MFENNFYRYRPKVCPEIGKIMKECNWEYNILILLKTLIPRAFVVTSNQNH